MPGTSLPRLGIALGGGSARGWAHIGVLSGLRERGIEPEIVCGTSIGALVGGIYSAGKLDELEGWVKGLTRRDVLGLVDLTVGGGGVIGGRRLRELYERHLGDIAIEDLPRTFAAVATDLRSGSEVWLRSGSLLEAIRASISLPGMFTPVYREGRWLVDGALVNPVPVNLCRALGAEIVIAIDLHGAGRADPHAARTEKVEPAVVHPEGRSEPRIGFPTLFRPTTDPADEAVPRAPGLAWVVQTALDIMQVRIGRSRLAGDPPDLLLAPRVLQIQPLDFAAGEGTIEEGRRVVRRMMPALSDLLGLDHPA